MIDEDRDMQTLTALMSLPAGLRDVIVLHDVAQLPIGEVAKRLGVSRHAAERRWMRAIVLMTERLAEMERGRGGG